MRLLPNWWAVLRYLWIVRVIGPASLLTGMEVALQLGRNFLGWRSGWFGLAAAIS